ncbi:MAG: SIR2 family NAD-dependent protein deacylase [Coriobacteriales bacterium]|jgi:NAD-dependent SIR2 family protein deacetylase
MYLSDVLGRMSSGITERSDRQIGILGDKLDNAEAVLVGAGSGLSTAAGLTYSGERFQRYFGDFAEAYGIKDMYSGGFYPFGNMETYWAWWSRHIYFNRYVKAPSDVYETLLELVKDKDYFVLTTNVDHQFQMAGFDKKRLFYTQGDYGLFQSTNPKIRKTYDNEEIIFEMMEAQGFVRGSDGIFRAPEDGTLKMEVPSELIPKCPDDGSDMTVNLRCDETFVQDDGWYEAEGRYEDFVRRHEEMRVLYLELGVGMNTPVIIKFPFWRAVAGNPKAFYVCLNKGEAAVPEALESRSLCINQDIADVLHALNGR